MRINIIAVGERMPGWVEAGYQEYARRLANAMPLNLIEISAEKRSKSADIRRIMQKESTRMLQAIPDKAHVIALDREGQQWSTEKLANQLEQWQQQGDDLAVLIGGPEGMTSECLARAQTRLSFSAMTFPHPLIRIMLAEQFYRAWSILQNHPYHK
jgi:23S rRNA (pseudouridine1915-N3)-methyltransferase